MGHEGDVGPALKVSWLDRCGKRTRPEGDRVGLCLQTHPCDGTAIRRSRALSLPFPSPRSRRQPLRTARHRESSWGRRPGVRSCRFRHNPRRFDRAWDGSDAHEVLHLSLAWQTRLSSSGLPPDCITVDARAERIRRHEPPGVRNGFMSLRQGRKVAESGSFSRARAAGPLKRRQAALYPIAVQVLPAACALWTPTVAGTPGKA